MHLFTVAAFKRLFWLRRAPDGLDPAEWNCLRRHFFNVFIEAYLLRVSKLKATQLAIPDKCEFALDLFISGGCTAEHGQRPPAGPVYHPAIYYLSPL